MISSVALLTFLSLYIQVDVRTIAPKENWPRIIALRTSAPEDNFARGKLSPGKLSPLDDCSRIIAPRNYPKDS